MQYFSYIMKGHVIWVTGLSGSGKTTLATNIRDLFLEKNKPTILLDGDELRIALNPMINVKGRYTSQERIKLAKSYSGLSKLLSDQGFVVVVATISLFHEVHHINRNTIDNYSEVYLRVPLSILKERAASFIFLVNV